MDDKISNFCRHQEWLSFWGTTASPEALFLTKFLAGHDADRWRRAQGPRHLKHQVPLKKAADWRIN